MPATAVAASRGDGDGGGGPEEGSGLAAASGDGDGGDTTARVPSRRGLLGGDELFWTTNISKASKETVQKFKEIDFFVSHSWSDTGHARNEVLMGLNSEVLMGLTGGRL